MLLTQELPQIRRQSQSRMTGMMKMMKMRRKQTQRHFGVKRMFLRSFTSLVNLVCYTETQKTQCPRLFCPIRPVFPILHKRSYQRLSAYSNVPVQAHPLMDLHPQTDLTVWYHQRTVCVNVKLPTKPHVHVYLERTAQLRTMLVSLAIPIVPFLVRPSVPVSIR